jgi:hypothetical protein
MTSRGVWGPFTAYGTYDVVSINDEYSCLQLSYYWLSTAKWKLSKSAS